MGIWCKRFKEKPDLATAIEYVSKGYYWNSGIFMFHSTIFKEEVEKHASDIVQASKMRTSLGEVFSNISRKISMDYGILEKSDKIVMVPSNRNTIGNINTVDYWNGRFGSGDWETKGGFFQTCAFAESQISHYNLPKHFSGSLCDFGCGAGDAFPVYHAAYPYAKLVGVDFSGEAIRLCREKYSIIAEFIQGDIAAVPFCDIVITSNVLEHLDSDKEVVNELLKRCKKLFAIVPYDERNFGDEHLRSYDKSSFADLFPLRNVVFLPKGWSMFGIDLWYQVYLKNIARFVLGRSLLLQKKQILFEFQGRRI